MEEGTRESHQRNLRAKNATNETAVNFEKKSARLERRIGQLLIEKEFLEGKCEELGIDTSEKP
jgi:hypothetical protein